MNLPEVAITNDTELHLRIMQLKALNFEQEQAINHNVREMVYSMHPSVLVKKVISEFSDDGGEVGGSLANAAVSLGKDFVIAKLFGRGNTLKGFLTSMLVRKATDYVLNKHPDLVVKGIGKIEEFLSRDKHHNNGHSEAEAA